MENVSLRQNCPPALVSTLDEVAHRIDRSKSWIVRDALSQWLAEEQRRYQLTIETECSELAM